VVWYRWEQVQGANWVVWSVQGKVDVYTWMFPPPNIDICITEKIKCKNVS
jgi:hypothetical protein